jgi:hypothetical protein
MGLGLKTKRLRQVESLAGEALRVRFPLALPIHHIFNSLQALEITAVTEFDESSKNPPGGVR